MASESSIIEHRSERVASLKGDFEPYIKACNFLKPCAVNINEQFLSVPPLTKPTSMLQAFLSKVGFKGRQIPPTNWKSWVQALHSKHHQTWAKAGIEKSILGSVNRIVKQNELIFEIADKWCPKTNTFIFPWGEITITLEDMLVLGGFSVLGDSVLKAAVDYDEGLLRLNEALGESWRKVMKISGKRNLSHYLWMDYFMGSEIETELEHAAFLVLWLSRFVFPRPFIRKDIFSVAVRLSKGCMLALGPAVLASIYRELSLLKQHIISKNIDCRGNPTPLWLLVPFQLVQVWIWERFPKSRPTPAGLIELGDPRVARWDNIHKSKLREIGLANAGQYYQWRPYTAALRNWQPPPELYQMESFARCIRVSQLVGLDCVEEYNPHRVAMQFGFDQDVPFFISRTGKSSDDVWINYNRPVKEMELYVPDRCKMPDVTQRYLDWWNEFILNKKGERKSSIAKKRRTTRDFPRSLKELTVDEDKLTIGEFMQTFEKNKSVQTGIESDVITRDPDFQYPSSTIENGVDMNPTLENTEENMQLETLRENGVDMNPTLENTEENMQLEPLRENGVDMNPTLENTEENMQLETLRENGVDMNPTLENTEENMQPETLRENDVDINPTLENTEENMQPETARENDVDINPTLENTEKQTQPETTREDEESTDLYRFKLEARIVQLERIFGKLKNVVPRKFGGGPSKT